MSEEINKSDIFYSRHPIMGYNAMLNYILSGRGNGKTFDFKRMALESKNQTVWLRRYDNDLPDVEREFMADLHKEGYFIEDSVTIKDDRLIINGETKIFFVPLSISNKKKSVAYPNVDYIVFDEFIETKKNRSYLPNEVEMLLDFIETVNRLRIDRPEVRVFFLANNISFVNPYFAYFKIRPFNGRFKKFKNGLIVVEQYSNDAFIALKKKSRFGQLIEGTKYGAYAIDNKSLRDTNDFLRHRHKDAVLKCNIHINDMFIGLWRYDDSLYLSADHNETTITFSPRNAMKEGEYVLKTNEVPILWIKSFHAIGKLYFEDNIIKDIGYQLMEESYK